MRVVLRDKPFCTVFFPKDWSQEKIDKWLWQYYNHNNLLH